MFFNEKNNCWITNSYNYYYCCNNFVHYMCGISHPLPNDKANDLKIKVIHYKNLIVLVGLVVYNFICETTEIITGNRQSSANKAARAKVLKTYIARLSSPYFSFIYLKDFVGRCCHQMFPENRSNCLLSEKVESNDTPHYIIWRSSK